MLSRGERAVIERLLPGIWEVDFAAFHADFEKTAPAAMRWGFRAALAVALWLSPVLIGRIPPLTRLGPRDSERALEALGRSRFYLLRQCLLLLKAVLSFCYGADAGVRRSIGYSP